MAVEKRNEVYKCNVCGNVVETVEVGGGELVCCGKPMELQKENAVDAATEKHVPVVSIEGNNVTVKVGSVEHPMGDEHYIEFIQLMKGDIVLAEKQLTPSDKPEAVFCIDDTDNIYAREYCNLHGLWRS